MGHTYKHPRPALAVDCVVFGFDWQNMKVLLTRRDEAPYKGKYAFPGTFVHIDETLEDAAYRALARTGIKQLYLEQLYSFGEVGRDARERVVTVTYYALVKPSDYTLIEGDASRHATWFSVHKHPPLAFDHETILEVAILRLKGKVTYQPIGFELLPDKFTLTQLQSLYETILERPLDKRNFRKKILGMKLLKPLDEKLTQVAHRAAQLYRFDEKKYLDLVKKGFHFEI